MRPVILFYSYTGNNRLLAETLRRRLDCPAIEVVERKPRTPVRLMFDLAFRRFPAIEPVALPPGTDHVLVVTPLWNRWIAHPMRSALRALRPVLGDVSIVTLSGGERKGQVDFVDRQIAALTGAPPVSHWAMYVDKLAPPEIRGTPKVSSYRVTSDQLASYPEVAEIVEWFTPLRAVAG